MKESHKIAKNFIHFSIGPILDVFIGLISVPITTRLLLPEENGKAAIYSTIEGICFFILLLGFNYALIRLYHESKDKKKLTFHAILLPFSFWFFVFLIGSFYYKEISLYLFGTSSYLLYLILAGNLIIDVFNTLSNTLIRMQEKAKLYSSLRIFMRINSFLITILYLLFIERSFYAIIFSFFLSHLVQSVILFYFTRDHWNFQKIDKSYLYSLFIMVLPLIPTDLISKLASGMDKWMLKEMVSVYEVGIYNSGFKFVKLFDVLSSTFSAFWLPLALRWYKEEKNISYYKKVYRSATYVVSVTLIILILLRNILVLYLGEAYRSSASFLPVLLTVPYFQILTIFSSTGVHISKKTKNLFLITIITTIVNAIGNLLLIPKMNSLGASIATGFSMLITWQCYAFFSRYSWKPLESFRQLITVAFIVFFVSLVSLGNKHEILYSFIVVIIISIINWSDIIYLFKLFNDLLFRKK